MRITLISLLLAAGAAACGSSTTASPPSQVEAAAEVCGVPAMVRDEGRSIAFDTEGDDDDFGHSIDDIVCMLLLLEVPEYVVNRMDNTRALDGIQSADWGDGLHASWSYHPGTGMNLGIWEDQ